MHHALSIYVKMTPDDKNEDAPSIGLTVSEHISEENLAQLEQLDVGDQIFFNATLVGMGDPMHLHHLHAYGIEKGTKKHHVDVHMHDAGRYKLKLPTEEQLTPP